MRQTLSGSNKKLLKVCKDREKPLSLHRFSERKHKRIVLWCNGSTTGFGSVCLGSNPGRTTQKRREDGELSTFVGDSLFFMLQNMLRFLACRLLSSEI